MLTTVALVLALALAAFLAYVAMQPSAFRVARSMLIAAPPPAVFAEVDDFHRWDAWSPWAKRDPNAKAEFSGAAAGVGAAFAWDGNKEIGTGRMTIVESRPHDLVRIRLEFLKPMVATNEARFTFEPEGAGTRVTWAMTGNNGFVGRLFCSFMNMDRMVGGDFEKGLAAMKAVAEAKRAV